MALFKACHHAVELALFLKGRVDQHQAALLLGRQMGAKNIPAVELSNPGLEIAGKILFKPVGVDGVQFETHEPVLAAQHVPGDKGRTGIIAQLALRVLRPDRIEIGGEQL